MLIGRDNKKAIRKEKFCCVLRIYVREDEQFNMNFVNKWSDVLNKMREMEVTQDEFC